MNKKIIKGCDSRGDGEEPYLTRWTLLAKKHLHIYFHKFHRSDSPKLHDHPWSFISIVLWRGYVEETFIQPPKLYTAKRKVYFGNLETDQAEYMPLWSPVGMTVPPTKKKRIYPGQIIYRPATHAHRVELINGKPAYTLLINFGYIRQWGFFTKNYWQHFISYFADNQCNTIKE